MNKHGVYMIFLILVFTEGRLQKDIGHSKKEVVGLCKTPDGYPRHCEDSANTTERSVVTSEIMTTQKAVEVTKIVKAVETSGTVTTQKAETTQNLVVTTVIPAKSTMEDPSDKVSDFSRKDQNGKIDTGSAALAAGICVAIALAGYTSLMVYRKIIL